MTTTDTTPDYEIAAAQLRDFYAGLGLQSTLTRHGERKETSTGGYVWDHYAYTLTFSRPGNPPQQDFPWKQGLGITDDPDPAEVLGSVARDYEDTKCKTFEEWAAEYGYDADSRAAEKIFKTCLQMGAQLRALGLGNDQIETLAGFASRL